MNVSVLLGPCPTEADLDTAAAQENCLLRRLPTWLSIQLRPEAVEMLHVYHGAQDWRQFRGQE